MCVCVCVCACVYMCMCVCVCMWIHTYVHVWYTSKRMHNKRTAAALGNMAAFAPLFSHQKRRTLMAKVPHLDGRIAAHLAKSAAIPYPGASRTNHKSFHKSAAPFLIKKQNTNFTNCYIIFDAYRIGQSSMEEYIHTIQYCNITVRRDTACNTVCNNWSCICTQQPY